MSLEVSAGYMDSNLNCIWNRDVGFDKVGYTPTTDFIKPLNMAN
jgi:hypothetical protein